MPDLRTLNTLHSEKLLGTTLPHNVKLEPDDHLTALADDTTPRDVTATSTKTCPFSAR